MRKHKENYATFLLGEVKKDLEKSLEKVDKIILNQIENFLPIKLTDFFGFGKKLRCTLFFICSGHKDSVEKESTLYLGAAIELIHLSSLIHDDLIDNSTQRREHKTLHFTLGPNLAVLIGDHLFTRGLRLVKNYGSERLLDILLNTVENMIEGEAMEEILSLEEKFHEENYLEIIGKKTASLFQASAQMGALVNHTFEESQTPIFGEIGFNFGMAYQIVDDCEDIFSEIDADLEQSKVTLPLIVAYKKNLIYAPIDFDNKTMLIDIIRESKSLEEAIKFAQYYIEKAESHLDKVKNETIKEKLSTLFMYLRVRSEALISS